MYYRLNSIPIQMPPLRDRGEDIVLLFRLFAMQTAEKYRMEKVTLTDDAKRMLMKYKWPGNVRQLKNITEQISILCPERVVTADILANFIPQDQESTQLAKIPGNNEHSFETEREILYKILFELQGNVNNLRQDMSILKKQLDEMKGSHIMQNDDSKLPIDNRTALQQRPIVIQQQPKTMAEDAIAEEYVEPENLNLNDIGRQMLEKALERNGGNRKKAASELGISDRTLYRRIKQYGLE